MEDSGIKFLIIGNGFLKKEVVALYESLHPKNVRLVLEYVEDDELRGMMLQSHVSLGQFERHKRLSRTIPHKCFESLALGLPYITAEAEGVAELLTHGESCLFVKPGDPQDLARKILMLKENDSLRERLASAGRKLYTEELTPRHLSQKIVELLFTL